MKLNLNYCLIVITILIFLYYCLGRNVFEGNTNIATEGENYLNQVRGELGNILHDGTDNPSNVPNNMNNPTPTINNNQQLNGGVLLQQSREPQPTNSSTNTLNSSINWFENSLNSLFPSLSSSIQNNTPVQPTNTIQYSQTTTSGTPNAATQNTNVSTPSDVSSNSLTSSSNTSDTYADSQHSCDTGMIWNQLANGCIPSDSSVTSSTELPTGQSDKYILKSQIVPPVCPACPQPITCSGTSENKCPPCPACERCPEPSFECKKVPNYNSGNNSFLPSINTNGTMDEYGLLGQQNPSNSPRPLLTDFSTFSK
jgi:hypothetical protein